jgi:hypothetical protein
LYSAGSTLPLNLLAASHRVTSMGLIHFFFIFLEREDSVFDDTCFAIVGEVNEEKNSLRFYHNVDLAHIRRIAEHKKTT